MSGNARLLLQRQNAERCAHYIYKLMMYSHWTQYIVVDQLHINFSCNYTEVKLNEIVFKREILIRQI